MSSVRTVGVLRGTRSVGPYVHWLVRLGVCATVSLLVLADSAVADDARQPAVDPAVNVAKNNQPVSLSAIVVTAEKYKSNLLKTPLAVSVFTPRTLAALNVHTVADLGQYAPNLTMARFGAGNLSDAGIFLRGIGLVDHIIFTDPSVGVYLDGVYLGRAMGADLSLANIERVEVLRGPQGTLYGRNTLGGAINVITRQPDTTAATADADATVGARGMTRISLYANMPLADNFALSVEGVTEHRNGIGRDVNVPSPQEGVGELNDSSGRIAALWQATARLSVLISADVVQDHDGQTPHVSYIISPAELTRLTGSPTPGAVAYGAQPLTAANQPSNPNDIGNPVPGLEATRNNVAGGALTVQYDFGRNTTLKWLSAYREESFTGGSQDDNSDLNMSTFPETGSSKQYSSELQLTGGAGQISYVGGLFWYYERGYDFQGPYYYTPFNCLTAGCFGPLGNFDEEQGTHSEAGYLNITDHLTNKLSLSAGARYSRDTKAPNALFSAWGTGAPRAYRRNTWSAPTASVAVNYQLDREDSVYIRYARGYQPGQYTPRPFGGASAFQPSPATFANNYEAGFKGMITSWWNVRLAAFWTTYSDLDLQEAVTGNAGYSSYVATVNARERGVELESTLRDGGWHATLSTGLISGGVVSVAPTVTATTGVVVGDQLALTPKWNAALAAGYAWGLVNGGTLDLVANYSYRTAAYGQIFNTTPERISPYGLAGFSLRYGSPGDSYSVSLFGSNIFDKVYSVSALNDVFHGFSEHILNNDRSEFGVEFTYHFK